MHNRLFINMWNRGKRRICQCQGREYGYPQANDWVDGGLHDHIAYRIGCLRFPLTPDGNPRERIR